MDTIIFLLSQNEIYVGDYYKEKLKEVKFEKADAWEVYCYEDFERLLEYMQYPLQYNHFKNNRLIFLFDDIIFYEWLKKAERLLSQSDGLCVRRIEPFVEALKKKKERLKEDTNSTCKTDEGYEEEEDEPFNAVALYEEVLKWKWEGIDQTLRYELVLSPATLYTSKKEEKKGFLQVQDLLDETSLVKEGTKVQKGDEVLAYDHHVQKLFGRTKVEKLTKKVGGSGCFYWYLKEQAEPVWACKDQVIGVVDAQEGTREEMLAWCKDIL